MECEPLLPFDQAGMPKKDNTVSPKQNPFNPKLKDQKIADVTNKNEIVPQPIFFITFPP